MSRERQTSVREQGLRFHCYGLPDVSSAAFRAAAHNQSLAVSRSANEKEDQAFIDAVSDHGE
jgi:hypothetical protein